MTESGQSKIIKLYNMLNQKDDGSGCG